MNKVTFFSGEENGIVKEHDAYNDSIFSEQYSQAIKLLDLTSSLRTPKLFIKEFGDFLMSCHQHCLGVNLLVQR